ncbi:MAG: RDD family protein [Isosphaerales bacterium]
MTIKSNFDLDVSDLADHSPGQRVISGFWRRLLAFILDGLLLGLVGVVLGLRLFDPLARLGGWGRLLGFCVAIVYFGVLNSSIAGGQTIGKRIMKIQVVDRSGHSISPGRSFLRDAVLGAPFFLNGLVIPPSATMSPIGYLIVFILLGFGGAIVYLFIFNRRTRQSHHDLIVGTFVIRTTPPGQVVGSIWRPHLIVVGGWLVVVIGLRVAATELSRQGVFPGLLKVQRSIQATGNVHMAEEFVGKKVSTVGGKLKDTKYLRTKAV